MRFSGMFTIAFGTLLGLGILERPVQAEDSEAQKAYEAAMAEGDAAAEKADWDKALAAYQKALKAREGDAAAQDGIASAECRGKFELVLDEENDVRMEFVWIRPGKFAMGSESGSWGGEFAESDLHPVTITRGFWMGKTEVTQEQWAPVMSTDRNLSEFKGVNLPVEMVSWDDCQEFLKKVNEKLSKGKAASLPTEAEWEYACRAGTTTDWSCAEKEIQDHAWTRENSGERTHTVAQKKPNPWGLYDMHGNVQEWCSDWEGPYQAFETDPKGPDKGNSRIIRGGSWGNPAVACQSAGRSCTIPRCHDDKTGFRVVVR